MVTTAEIARIANVSVPVVSKVLNGGSRNNSRVSEAKRRHVLEVAERLGYRPNTAARSVRSGRFQAVGLLMSEHSFQSTIFGDMLRGLHAGLESAGYHLTVNFIDDRRLTSEEDLPKVLGQAMVDGIVLNYTHGVPPAMIRLLRQHNLPTVWLNARREADCVYIDDFAGARDATRRLLAAGHERVLYADFTAQLEAAPEVHYSRPDRRAGYEAAMREAGREPLTIAPVADRNAIDAAGRLLGAQEPPTAVLTYGGREADAFAFAAYAGGLRPGRDVEIVTFGVWPRPAGPPLTTWQLPEADLGRAAADMLLARIRSPANPAAPRAVPMIPPPGDTVSPPTDDPRLPPTSSRTNAGRPG